MTDIILDVRNLVGGYGKMTILNGTTFSVPKGSITTVIGPNGAGKSTVFKAIFGLLKLREGEVVFKGRNETGLSQRDLLTAGICYIPQGRNLFPELSVRHQHPARRGRGRTRHHGFAVADRSRAGSVFRWLRKKSEQQASTLSGGEAEAARKSPVACCLFPSWC
ncbi:MAG: ATP-binding cassette domain-containing protein [Bradyrhizobium sp.]